MYVCMYVKFIAVDAVTLRPSTPVEIDGYHLVDRPLRPPWPALWMSAIFPKPGGALLDVFILFPCPAPYHGEHGSLVHYSPARRRRTSIRECSS